MLNLPRLDWQVYTPAFAGNRDDPDPMTVDIKLPSYGDVLRRRAAASEKDGLGEYNRRQLLMHTRNYRNLVVAGEKVTTAEEVWRLSVDEDAISYELVIELLEALNNRESLEAGLKNGSPSPSGSTG